MFGRRNLRTSTSISSGLGSRSGSDEPPSPNSISSQFSASVQSRPDSTNPSSMSSHSHNESLCEDGSCPIDPDEWFAAFQDDSDLAEYSDTLPNDAALEKAGNINVYDADGVSRPFRSLYQGNEHQGQRQLMIFVRHFYCSACQGYLKVLTDTITPSAYFALPIPTTITIIGCGAPHLIPRYTTTTGCPFRVYSDPSRKLYKALGMRWTINIGKRPEYIKEMSAAKLIASSLRSMLKTGRTSFRDGLSGGPLPLIGGEFLFGEGEAIWCHRMKNVRNHTEMSTLKKVLEMDDEVAVVEEAKAVPVSPTSPAKGLRLVWEGDGVTAHLQRDSRLVASS